MATNAHWAKRILRENCGGKEMFLIEDQGKNFKVWVGIWGFVPSSLWECLTLINLHRATRVNIRYA